MDEIRIENLQVYAHHGVYKEENENGQNFYVNAVLYTDAHPAGTTDDLNLTTSYGDVCQFLYSFIQDTMFHLIETVAERTAEALLVEFPNIAAVDLEIRKPEAPVGLPFESVSVKINRRWHTVYLAVGSNMGDRLEHIDRAYTALSEDKKCRMVAMSELYETTAYGDVKQDDFLNGAWEIQTLYTPEELLDKVHELEQAAGRERRLHWGPRTLDLDILLYDDLVMHTDTLQIPHIDMQNRDFVLKPLSQIAPYQMHPVLGMSIIQLYEELKKSGEQHVIDLKDYRI